jgi:tetratricopeptide (TPR) repeat protein/TolB-like protein
MMPHGRRLETASRPYAAEDAEALRQALARVVASEPFRNAPRLIAFLSFIVEKTIAGEAGGLKGYTIATQALGRPDDFDPQADPIVRVEAGRLRRALQAYYEGEGATDPLRIVVPVGGYVPLLEEREAAPPEAIAPEPIAPEPQGWPKQRKLPEATASPSPSLRARRPARLAPALVAALAFLALGIGWVAGVSFDAPELSDSGLAQVDREDGRPVVVVQPLRTVGAMPEGFSPGLMRSVVAGALAKFDGLIVLDREQEPASPSYPHYDLRFRASREGEGVHVGVRLTHRPSGEVLWTREIEIGESARPGERELAGAVAVAIGQPFGVIFSDLRARAQEGSEAHCLVLAHDSRFGVSATDHARVRGCLEAAVAARPTYHLGYALLTSSYVLEHRLGFNARPDALDRALRAARRAVELAPQSARAHYAMMSALFARNEPEAALREGQLAVALNPYNSDIAAELGARYVQLGRYTEGLALLDRAIAANPGRPPWYDFYKFVAAYMEGDLATARGIAATFVGDRYFYGPFVRALMAYRDGEKERAKELLREAQAAAPHLFEEPRRALERAGFCSSITERFVTDLRHAGLASPPNPAASTRRAE